MRGIYDLNPGTTKTITRTTITTGSSKKKKKKKIGASRKQFFGASKGSKISAREGLTGLFRGRGLI